MLLLSFVLQPHSGHELPASLPVSEQLVFGLNLDSVRPDHPAHSPRWGLRTRESLRGSGVSPASATSTRPSVAGPGATSTRGRSAPPTPATSWSTARARRWPAPSDRTPTTSWAPPGRRAARHGRRRTRHRGPDLGARAPLTPGTSRQPALLNGREDAFQGVLQQALRARFTPLRGSRGRRGSTPA